MTKLKKLLQRWRWLSFEVFVAAFGYRAEIDLVPFQFARPQIGFSPALGRRERLPAVKFGPFHFWMMKASRFELGVSIDLNASFHGHVFQRVYPDAFVWPDYAARRQARKQADGAEGSTPSD